MRGWGGGWAQRRRQQDGSSMGEMQTSEGRVPTCSAALAISRGFRPAPVAAATHLPALPLLQAQRVRHGGGRSTLELDGGVQVSGSLVVDATGHSRKLVEFDKPFNPGEGLGAGVGSTEWLPLL